MEETIEEMKTSSKLTLDRLNQLLTSGDDKCPFCGCDCATAGSSDEVHDSENKDADLEAKIRLQESQISKLSEAFRKFQNQIECVISKLPETAQEALAMLFNVVEPVTGQYREIIIKDGNNASAEDNKVDVDVDSESDGSLHDVMFGDDSDSEESVLNHEISDKENRADSGKPKLPEHGVVTKYVDVKDDSDKPILPEHGVLTKCVDVKDDSNKPKLPEHGVLTKCVDVKDDFNKPKLPEHGVLTKCVDVKDDSDKPKLPEHGVLTKCVGVKDDSDKPKLPEHGVLTKCDGVKYEESHTRQKETESGLEKERSADVLQCDSKKFAPKTDSSVAPDTSDPKAENIIHTDKHDSTCVEETEHFLALNTSTQTVEEPLQSTNTTDSQSDTKVLAAMAVSHLETTTKHTPEKEGVTRAVPADAADSTQSSSPHKVPEVVVQTEKRYVEETSWDLLGAKELAKAKALGLCDKACARTVICVDISASMTENDAWNQAKSFFSAFMSGLEDIKIEHDDLAKENIALCTFGHNTGVVQRLTQDFCDIRTAFKSLKLGGPSPMYGGFMMSVAGLAIPDGKYCSVHGAHCSVYGMPVQPRIILVTDGYFTERNLIAGPDQQIDSKELEEANSEILLLSQKLDANRIKLTCVPVGQHNKEFLELVVAATDGKLVSFTDGRKEAEETLKMFSVESVLRDLRIRHETDNKMLPKIGSRVRRGPDWKWREQDSYGPGTVIGHDASDLLASVEWDADGHTNVYRYGEGGAFDLLLVDEPRILSKFETIAVGCCVKRGPGWKVTSDDIGAADRGVVIKYSDSTVTVQWNNKKRGTYKWDGSRKGEIVVCEPSDKAFHGDGHVLGGGPEFEERQTQQQQDTQSTKSPKKQRKIRNKNKNIV